MKFIESELLGAYIIQPSKLEDERGFFSRMFCKVELEKLNLDPTNWKNQLLLS